MPSEMTFCTIFSIVAFIGGFAFGALTMFSVSLHRTHRASLFEVSGQRRGALSRSVLVTTRANRKENTQ